MKQIGPVLTFDERKISHYSQFLTMHIWKPSQLISVILKQFLIRWHSIDSDDSD
jgi:hypothetical protein